MGQWQGVLLRAPTVYPFPSGLRRGPLPTPHRVSRHPCDFLCLDPVPDVNHFFTERILSRKLPAQTQTCP